MLIDALQQTKNNTTININRTETLCQMHKPIILDTVGVTNCKVVDGFSTSSFTK